MMVGLREARNDAPEEAAQFVGMRRSWWLDGAHWALDRWERAATQGPDELRLATTQGQPPVTGVDGLDVARMTHAWSILTAETNPDRWEPDRYNAAAFVTALLDKYEWLATATLADLAPKYAARLTSTVETGVDP